MTLSQEREQTWQRVRVVNKIVQSVSIALLFVMVIFIFFQRRAEHPNVDYGRFISLYKQLFK